MRNYGARYLLLRFRQKMHHSVVAGLGPAIHAPQAQAVLVLVDARPKSLSSGRAKRGPVGRARRLR